MLIQMGLISHINGCFPLTIRQLTLHTNVAKCSKSYFFLQDTNIKEGY